MEVDMVVDEEAEKLVEVSMVVLRSLKLTGSSCMKFLD